MADPYDLESTRQKPRNSKPEPTRPRPRPNQITVDLTPELREMLDKCVAILRKEKDDPFFSATQLVRDLIFGYYSIKNPE